MCKISEDTLRRVLETRRNGASSSKRVYGTVTEAGYEYEIHFNDKVYHKVITREQVRNAYKKAVSQVNKQYEYAAQL